MTKTEFIERLCSALTVSGSDTLVTKNREYYTEYIEGEKSKGRTEEEILGELGEPELIANSILEANGYKDRFVDDNAKIYNAYDTPDGDPTTFAQGFEYRGKGRDDGTDTGSDGAAKENAKKGSGSKAGLIIFLIIAVLLMIGIVVLIVIVFGGIIALIGAILIPVLIIWLVYRLIKSATKK